MESARVVIWHNLMCCSIRTTARAEIKAETLDMHLIHTLYRPVHGCVGRVRHSPHGVAHQLGYGMRGYIRWPQQQGQRRIGRFGQCLERRERSLLLSLALAFSQIHDWAGSDLQSHQLPVEAHHPAYRLAGRVSKGCFCYAAETLLADWVACSAASFWVRAANHRCIAPVRAMT